MKKFKTLWMAISLWHQQLFLHKILTGMKQKLFEPADNFFKQATFIKLFPLNYILKDLIFLNISVCKRLLQYLL